MKLLSNRFLLLFAWFISIAASTGSLYFSEVMKFIPCTYCWYQRILMYPLTILLGIAYFKRDFSIRFYVLPLTILGFLIGCVHYLEQKVHLISNVFGATCRSVVPCSTIEFELFGFVTIPFMALTAFMFITFALLKIKK